MSTLNQTQKYIQANERHDTQQCRRAKGRYRSNLGFHNTSAWPKAALERATQNRSLELNEIKLSVAYTVDSGKLKRSGNVFKPSIPDKGLTN